MNRRLLMAITALAALTAPHASAEDVWIKDQITGCAVWGGDAPAAAEDIVSWSGDCEDGKASGDGVISWFAEGALYGRYKGEMRDGRIDGIGRLQYRLDEGFITISGKFDEGAPHGAAAVEWPNGDRFVGVLEGSLDTGEGVFDDADGGRMRGAWRDGVVLGPVVFENAAGEVFKGVFADNVPTEGILLYPDGARYEGPFENGAPGGEGELSLRDGGLYLGAFADGEPHGEGVFIAADGSEMTGAFSEGWPDGEMSIVRADGAVETQVWKNREQVK